MKPGMIGRGIAAGFVATVVLSAMMLVKHSMGLMPELDPIAMITAMAGANSPALGWIAHFVIGSILWGIGFAVVSPYLPGPFWLRGVIFAVGAWLLMMIVMMPMAGAGLFGLGLSMMTPVATLVCTSSSVWCWAGFTSCSAPNKRQPSAIPAERCQVATASRIPNHDARVRSTSRSRCREVARLARIRPGSTRRWRCAAL